MAMWLQDAFCMEKALRGAVAFEPGKPLKGLLSSRRLRRTVSMISQNLIHVFSFFPALGVGSSTAVGKDVGMIVLKIKRVKLTSVVSPNIIQQLPETYNGHIGMRVGQVLSKVICRLLILAIVSELSSLPMNNTLPHGRLNLTIIQGNKNLAPTFLLSFVTGAWVSTFSCSRHQCPIANVVQTSFELKEL
jgi:hypothetical protein